MDLQAVLQATFDGVKSIDPWEVGKALGGLSALGFLLKGTRTLARIEAHMAAHSQHDDERFAAIEKRFEGVDRRDDGMRAAIHQIGDKIAGLTDAIVSRVQVIVSRLEERLEDTNGRIDRHLEEKP